MLGERIKKYREENDSSRSGRSIRSKASYNI